jgi:hypothetical protein
VDLTNAKHASELGVASIKLPGKAQRVLVQPESPPEPAALASPQPQLAEADGPEAAPLDASSCETASAPPAAAVPRPFQAIAPEFPAAAPAAATPPPPQPPVSLRSVMHHPRGVIECLDTTPTPERAPAPHRDALSLSFPASAAAALSPLDRQEACLAAWMNAVLCPARGGERDGPAAARLTARARGLLWRVYWRDAELREGMARVEQRIDAGQLKLRQPVSRARVELQLRLHQRCKRA